VEALIGVALGAVIGGLGEYALLWRRDRRRLRAARRMLALELKEAEVLIRESVEKARWSDDPTRVLSNEQWSEFREAWSTDASEPRWDAVSEAFLAVARARRAGADAKQGDSLSSEAVSLCGAALASIPDAAEALLPQDRR